MSITKASLIDLNGQELILDADADTSITADTDDQIDIKIAGSDVITLTSSNTTLRSGSSLTINRTDNSIGGVITYGPSSGTGFTFNDANGDGIDFTIASTNLASFNSGEAVFNDGGNDKDFRVESNGQTNMFFIDGADDAVVIGNNASRKTLFNTTATAAFQIEGTSGNTAAMSIVRNSNDDNGPQLVLGKSNGTSAGAVTVVTDDALLGRISFQGADGTQTVEGARIEAFVDGTPGADDMPGRLTFSTTADGASTVTERMRIDKAGDVQARRARSNTAGEVALSIQPSDSVIHYGFRIDSSANSLNLDRVDSAGNLLSVTTTGRLTTAADIVPGADVIMSSGRGISFAATSDATGMANELLDDYEEGTWTPTLPSGGTLTNVGSNYTKIGRLVHLTSYIQTITPTNNSSGLQIGGLPFPVWASGYSYSAGSFSYIGTSSGNVNKFGLLAAPGGSYLYFHYIDGTGGSGVTNAQWIAEMGSGTGIHLIFHTFYYTDS